MGNILKLFYIVMIAISGVFGYLLYTNYESFVSSGTIDIEASYILSVKPKIVTNAFTTISSNSLSGQIPTDVSLVIVDPDSKRFTPKEELGRNTYYFTKDFDMQEPIYGNYTVLLTNTTSNEILASVNFQVAHFFSTVASFILGQGLGFFFGTIGPLVPLILERASKSRDDNIRRLEEKSKWMNDNMKYYLELSGVSENISELFKEKRDEAIKLPLGKEEKLLDLLVKFQVAYDKFRAGIVGVYYFDDIKAEDFLANLQERILNNLDKIFKNLNFRAFAKDYSESEAAKNMLGYSDYIDALRNWLDPFPRDSTRKDSSSKLLSCHKDFYRCFVTYAWILRMNVNNAALITYSVPNELKKEFRYIVRDLDFENQVEFLNKLFYDVDQSRFYRATEWYGPYYRSRWHKYFGK